MTPQTNAFVQRIKVSRAAVFGPDDPQLPNSEQQDADIPQLGYIGKNYRKGGDILLGINPGGGRDAYRRTPEDGRLLPRIAALRDGSHSNADLDAVFEICMENMRTWNLWRIVEPVLGALGKGQDEIAYLNWCPFRTRNDAMPRAYVMRNCRASIVDPLIAGLAPRRVIALGKKVGKWVTELPQDAHIFVVPRTNGDRYLSERARAVLNDLRTSTGARP